MGTSLVTQNHKDVAAALAKAEEQRKQAERTVAELAAVAASFTPQEPDGIGTVVRFTRFDGYQYAAIRGKDNFDGGGVWYVTQDPNRTGGNKIPPQNWSGLLDKIGSRHWASLEVLQ